MSDEVRGEVSAHDVLPPVGGYVRPVTIRRAALLLAVALTALLAWVVALPPLPGREGAVLLGISHDHGVHVSDLPAAFVWAVGMAACGWLWRRS